MSSDAAGGSDARPHVPLGRELAIGMALFGVYVVVHLLRDPAARAVADAHARDLAALERDLGLDMEGAANAWLNAHPSLWPWTNTEYSLGYLVPVALLLVWAYLRRPAAYRSMRTSFVILTLIAITTFLLYPLTPPRMLPDLGMVDTVASSGGWSSWGSPWIEGLANHLAAMPSVHVAWALWVSVELARIPLGRWAWVRLAAAANVALTAVATVATANHFVLDVVAAVVAVALALVLARAWERRTPRPGRAVPAADAFYWHIEPLAPQIVGGVGLLDTSGAPAPTLTEVRRRAQQTLLTQPAFRRRLDPGTHWRRPRWVDVDDVDLRMHVLEHDLGASGAGPAGVAGLNHLVSDLVATPLPPSRPMWRLVLVQGVAPDVSALVLLAHHAMGDGLGVVASALGLFEPPVEANGQPPPAPPGVLTRAALLLVGLAQLATDGSPRAPLSRSTARARQVATASLDLDTLAGIASRHGCRVTDVLLSAAAGALVRRRPDLVANLQGRLRVVVPLLVADPSITSGNVTGGVMVDLPLEPVDESDRLGLVAARTARRITASRALASRFVVSRGLAVVPTPAARWFARTVYGHRFFHGIVSNMAGPLDRLRFGGALLHDVVPLVPLAPGAPFAVGALGWNGQVGVSVMTDPTVLSAQDLCSDLADVVDELAAASVGTTRTGLGVDADRLGSDG